MRGSFKERLDEIDEKYREQKKKKKKKKRKVQPKPGGLNGVLHGFNEKQAKGNLNNTLLKTVADLAGVGIGTAVSAAAGKFAPLIGVALIGTGHYIGDESGLLRVAGAAAVAHSVAKSKEYRQEGSTMKDRLSGLKDDWLRLALLKHEEAKSDVVPPTAAAPVPFVPVTPAAVSTKTEAEPKPDPVQPLPERRKTPYQQEIEKRQSEMQEEAEQLRLEMEQYEREERRQNGAESENIDLSRLDALQQSLYGSAQQHLQNGNFNPDLFEGVENDEDGQSDFDKPVDDGDDGELPSADYGQAGSKQLWPPESRGDYDEFLENDDYDFNDY